MEVGSGWYGRQLAVEEAANFRRKSRVQCVMKNMILFGTGQGIWKDSL